MNVKRLILSLIGVVLFVIAFDFLFHGIVLKNMYELTKFIWRPEPKMGAMLFSQLSFSLAMGAMYVYLQRQCDQHANTCSGCKLGVVFGVGVGLILGAVKIGSYCYLPIPLSLVISWVGLSVLKCIGVGCILGVLYKQ